MLHRRERCLAWLGAFFAAERFAPDAAPPWVCDRNRCRYRGNQVEVPLGQLPFGLDVPKGVISLGDTFSHGRRLVFMAGTLDPHIRAFDVTTGREVWQATLPTSARPAR